MSRVSLGLATGFLLFLPACCHSTFHYGAYGHGDLAINWKKSGMFLTNGDGFKLVSSVDYIS
jgi:hypothetical protein